VNADHAAQLRLLDLQAVDTALAQLAHRRRVLPELATLADREERASVLAGDVVEAQTRVDDVADQQRRLENEVDAVRARTTRDQERMQSGALPAKEIESLQHEVTTLARRQSNLEDDLLEVMEQREEADAAVTQLTEQRGAIDTERAELVASRDSAFAEIDSAVETHTGDRKTIAAEIPSDLLTMYERAREHGGGVGAAMIKQRRCEGCRIELSGSELTAVRAAAPDEVVRCDNCRRILIRTDESGL
jgi:predicted  nucleic acid-binding Zn-ribbon protein